LMQALVVGGWGQAAEVAEIDSPAPGPGECLVEVREVLLGAGDVFFSQGIDYKSDGASFVFPHIPGFRGSGVVVSSPVETLPVGTRVAINGVVGCGDCPPCRSGADNRCTSSYLLGLSSGHFGSAAELIAAPARQLHPIPDEMSFTESLLVSDAALLIHAFRRGRLMLGENLAVVGAGRIGTMAIAVASAAGAQPIVAVDPSSAGRAAALRAGATSALDLGEAGAGATDVVLEAVGTAESIATALSLGRAGGRTILLGLLGGVQVRPSYYADVISKENELITTFGKTNEDFRAAIGLVGGGHVNVERLPIRTYAWSDALEAWQDSMSAPGARNAITLSPAVTA
jgi:L-iditol 2-dehydrogenase